MSHWPFVIAAYAVAIGGVGALIVWALASMRRAEGRLDRLLDK